MNTSADIIVAGGGLVGLCTALAVAERGLLVRLLADERLGESSPAAAGMLAPSLDPSSDPVALAFAVAARDRYPSYLAWLAERSHRPVELNRLGLLEVALDEEHAERLRRSLLMDACSPSAHWLDAAALAELEPALSHASGAVLHANDGATDNVALLTALWDAVASNARIEVVRTAARSVETRDTTHSATVALSDSAGVRHEAPIVVLAAGAWVNQLAGVPRSLHVEPMRGQMIAYEAVPVRHVSCGPNGYLVPRASGETLAGATMEREGFDVRTTDAARQSLQRSAEQLCPALEGGTVLRQWAGLRPVTPDFQPIIGADPEHPGLLYACGHSRNGVLMAPLTGDCIAALAAGVPSPIDLSPFSVSRFDGAFDSAISRR